MVAERPLLTIAIPTFNGAGTIRQMLNLLLPQVDERVEVVAVDNGSTDATPSILSEYRSQYPVLQYVRNEKNIGADGNFLKCMRIASGKYVYLLSDDDVLTENSLNRILSFLAEKPDMGLVYLNTANFYVTYQGRDACSIPMPISEENLFTRDKRIFFAHARHYWGFLSSFIISKDRFAAIETPEQYFGTYWLQSYIHILCAAGADTNLGAVGGLCVGAGVYITQSNFDTAFVDGLSYKRMLDFAVKHGFDGKQLERWYVRRICMLASHGIVKEKATGNHKINPRLLFQCTWRYPLAWIRIYPFFLVPAWVCGKYMEAYRKKKGAGQGSKLNRAGDIPTE